MKDFVQDNYRLKSKDYEEFAAFLVLNGQTENTERDLFAWLLDKYLASKYKDLWVLTEDKAGDGSSNKKAFDLSVIRWSKELTPIHEHIMEFKSERHGKFLEVTSVKTNLDNKILPDIHKMRKQFDEEGGRENKTKYWQCQIFYSFFTGDISLPSDYARYVEHEKSSTKGIGEKSAELNQHYEKCIKNFQDEMEDNARNEKGRKFLVRKEDEGRKSIREEKEVKFKVNSDQSIIRNIAKSEHRGVILRSDLYLMSIDFDI